MRGNNLLDLVITSTPDKVSIYDVVTPTDAGISTDHASTLFDFTIQLRPPSTSRAFVYDYRRANLTALRQAINDQKFCDLIDHAFSVNDNWEKWKQKFEYLVKNMFQSSD